MGLFRHRCSKCGAWCVWISDDGYGNFGWYCKRCAEHEELLERIQKLEKKLR
jgi:hypothetical protein